MARNDGKEIPLLKTSMIFTVDCDNASGQASLDSKKPDKHPPTHLPHTYHPFLLPPFP